MMIVSREGRVLYVSESIANYLGLRQVTYSSGPIPMPQYTTVCLILFNMMFSLMCLCDVMVKFCPKCSIYSVWVISVFSRCTMRCVWVMVLIFNLSKPCAWE